MGKLVKNLEKRMKCEVFPCKQNAEFAIGREGHKALNFNVCREDARQIMEDLIEIFAGSDELDHSSDGIAYGLAAAGEIELENLAGKEIAATYADEITGKPETLEPDLTPTSDETPESKEVTADVGNDAPQNQDEPEDGEETGLLEPEVVFAGEPEAQPVPEPIVTELYTCKYCGATFPKTPAGKTALMTHTKACAKLAKQAQV